MLHTISKTLIDMLLLEQSSLFDNHKKINLSDYRHIHYLGFSSIKSSTYQHQVYVATLNQHDYKFHYSTHTNNYHHLIVMNYQSLNNIIDNKKLDFIIDYDLNIFKKILKTWTPEEIRLQVIFS